MPKEKQQIKAIFFDLGQTLVNLSLISVSMYNTLKKHLPQDTACNLSELVHAWGYGTRDLFMKSREKEFITTRELHFRCLKKIAKMNNILLSDYQAHSMVEDVWNDFIINNKIYFDTLPTLNQLKNADYILGLITDSDEDIVNGILQKHKFVALFDIKIISSMMKSYKPNPILFKEAIKQAKCKPIESIYVGDSELDIKGAKEVGLITIIIDRGEINYPSIGIEPDYRISKLSELIPIMTKIKHK